MKKLPSIHHQIISNNLNLINKEIDIIIEDRCKRIAEELAIDYSSLKDSLHIEVTSPDMDENGQLIGMDKCYIPKIIFYTITLNDKVMDSFSISLDYNFKPM